MPPIADYDRTLVVGVRRVEWPANGSYSDDPFSLALAREAVRAIETSLIQDLRESGLYREVDYVDQLTTPADLVLVLEGAPRLSSCEPDTAWVLLALGAIPAWTTCDRGNYFAIEGTGDHFAFPWHETRVLGWISPVLDLFPDWTLDPPPPGPRYDAFRAFLLAHRSELLTKPASERPP